MNEQESRSLLLKIALFQDLNEEELARIGQLLVRRNVREKDVVFRQAEELTTLYFIAAGKVKIVRTDEHGREQVVNVLQAGDLFPHAGFFRPDALYPADAVCLEDGVLLALSTSRFRTLLETHPPLCLKLMAVLESKYMDLQARLAEMVMHDTFGRIVSQLLRLARLHGMPDGCRMRLGVPLTNQELANMIGTTRETVNRTLNQLKKTGAVEMSQDNRLLLDVNQLERQLRI